MSNNLTVTPIQNSADSQGCRLSTQVEFELNSTKAFSLNRLQIQSQDGTVTSSGSVSSKAEKILAEKITQTVEDVWKIVNNLTVMKENQRK